MNSNLIPFLKNMGFSQYVLMLAEQSDEKIKQECLRLVEKMRAAIVYARNIAITDLLLVPDNIEKRIENETTAWLAKQVEDFSSRIVKAQRLADPSSRLALILHTSKEKWSEYDDYNQYQRRFDAFTKRNMQNI